MGFFPITWARYRKAIAAAVGAFLATFPVASFVGGDLTDPKTVAGSAFTAAVVAAFTILAKPNEA